MSNSGSALLLLAVVAVNACSSGQASPGQPAATVTVTTTAPAYSAPADSSLSFESANEFAVYLEVHGDPCYGTDQTSARQRSCADDFAITVWADNATALRQARDNVDALEQNSIIVDFIVVGNGMIAPPDFRSEEMLEALSDDGPIHVD